MSAAQSPWLPPRWFIHFAWRFHRAYHQVSGGRRGLWPPAPGKWGTMRLTVVGRRTGKQRSVILGYFEDGPNLVTLAMNGWGDPEPAWWLNLLANPEAAIELKDRSLTVRARRAAGEERERLWARWREYDGDKLDGWAARRARETAVVVLEPITAVVDQRV